MKRLIRRIAIDANENVSLELVEKYYSKYYPNIKAHKYKAKINNFNSDEFHYCVKINDYFKLFCGNKEIIDARINEIVKKTNDTTLSNTLSQMIIDDGNYYIPQTEKDLCLAILCDQYEYVDNNGNNQIITFAQQCIDTNDYCLIPNLTHTYNMEDCAEIQRASGGSEREGIRLTLDYGKIDPNDDENYTPELVAFLVTDGWYMISRVTPGKAKRSYLNTKITVSNKN